MDWFKDLQWRGLVNAITNEEKLVKFMQNKKAAYVGFDPSAASLHLGNYIMIMMVRRLNLAGVKTYAVVGGATGMIGDPSGKSNERNLLDEQTVLNNKAKIVAQLRKYATSDILDNYDHFKNMNYLTFLRDIGKFVNINYLLEKEIIKKRLETTGLSYTEFSYNLIQSYDFFKFYKDLDVHMQIGGSDQWGNITAGIELIRKMLGDDNNAVGMTMNLLTNSEGKKFGKSEKGAIYLDKSMTSPYEMYQFLLNQTDNDVIKLLKVFTLLSKEEIESIEKQHLSSPASRIAQNALANWVVSDIHGQDELDNVIEISQKLFKGEIASLKANDLKNALSNVPNIEVMENEYNIVDFLVINNIAKSKTQARELITSNAIAINGKCIDNQEFVVKKSDAFDQEFTVTKKGKKSYYLTQWKH